jgi:AcrR family transcriptional regulator
MLWARYLVIVTDAALLEAAQRAIEAHGYAGATLERIADEAGLSRVTLHRRGVSKDSLLADLVAHATEDYRAAMWPALTGDGTGADRLHDALGALCGAAEQHLALLVALRSQSDAVFHRREDVALTRGVWTAPLERLLRDGAADGSLRASEDPAETATVLFNLIGWTYRHLRTGHGWTPERAARGVLSIALEGVTR